MVPAERRRQRAPFTGERRYGRIGWILVAATMLLILIIVLVVFGRGQAVSVDGLTTDTGGRVALVSLALAALLPLSITKLTVTVPRWVLWAVGGLSLFLVGVMWLLATVGSDSAWAVYGGLQVLRADNGFSDLDWVVQWISCGLCEEWDPNYGPGLAALGPLLLGPLGPSWVPIMGFAMAVAMTLSLVWMGALSTGRGALVVVVAALGPAWLLMLDRANLDALVLLAFVAGAWVIGRRNTIWAWVFFAVIIWVMGTLKFYPFVMALALAPVLRLHRGWVVLAGFGTATAAFFLVSWDSIQETMSGNSSMIRLEDFPAYGRLVVVDRMVGLTSGEAPVAAASALVFLLAVAAFLWGVWWARGLSTTSVILPVLAVGGSTAYLTAVLAAGFAFMYKGAFLLLVIPLLSLPRGQRSRFHLYTSVFTLLCLALALTIGYGTLLTTLAGITAASVAFGAGLSLCLRMLVGRSEDLSGPVRAHEHA